MPDIQSFGNLGWLGYVGMAIAIAINYFPKAWKESRAEDKEAERLLSALSDERNAHKETKVALNEAHAQILKQINDFGKMTSENATLSERMLHMSREQERLAKLVERQAATIEDQNNQIKEQNEQIKHLTDQVQNLQVMLKEAANHAK